MLPGARGGNQAEGSEAADAEVMFVATNTAFRAATRQTTDRPRTVERLDTVIQAYGEVLRAAPANVDAAYNYEYAVRRRDIIARGKNNAPQNRHARSACGRRLFRPQCVSSVALQFGHTIRRFARRLSSATPFAWSRIVRATRP